MQAPSDEHDAAVLAAIEREDAVVRQRIVQQLNAPSASFPSSSCPPGGPSSSRCACYLLTSMCVLSLITLSWNVIFKHK